jgi:hypothetical protein
VVLAERLGGLELVRCALLIDLSECRGRVAYNDVRQDCRKTLMCASSDSLAISKMRNLRQRSTIQTPCTTYRPLSTRIHEGHVGCARITPLRHAKRRI